jgi:hypothetical protein
MQPWPFSSIDDIVGLYPTLLTAFVTGRDVPHGTQQGFYFCVSGLIR